jgi:hypothetical protein
MNHLVWDLVMFVALCSVCERRWSRRTRLVLLASAAAIGAMVMGLAAEVEKYRGLSGLDSALFGLLAVSLLSEAGSRASRTLVACLWMLMGGFAGKVGYELASGSTFFVDSRAAGFVPVPLAHAVGFLAGAIVARLNKRPPIGRRHSISYNEGIARRQIYRSEQI